MRNAATDTFLQRSRLKGSDRIGLPWTSTPWNPDMTIAENGRISPLADRVLAHVAQWAQEPFHPAVLEAGRELLGQEGIDQAILAIASAVNVNHGAEAYAHYRGYLLDAACHHTGSLIVDGEIRQVQSQLFLIALDGDLGLIEDQKIVDGVIDDLLCSLETTSASAESLTILPRAYTLTGLAGISPEAIRRLIVADREAFSHELEPILEWGIHTECDQAEARLSHPAATYGERALIGISHRLVTDDGEGAIERLANPAVSDRWHAAMNAASRELRLRVHATLAWTETMAHLAVQRLATGLQTDARLTARTTEDGLLHLAQHADGNLEGWIETDTGLYGPVFVPAIAANADGVGFQTKLEGLTPFFIRYADPRHLPKPSDGIAVRLM